MESEQKKDEENHWRITRRREREDYHWLSGDDSKSCFSIQTILKSPPQLKLIALGGVWYAFQMAVYAVLANLLVYITFHNVKSLSPGYPGAAYGSDGPSCANKTNLYDTGFQYTPDLSYRPYWLKTIFVDMMVSMAQVLPPTVLVLTGKTRRFICYVGIVGIQNILKGLVQVMTILPPARQGEACWELNFSPEELETMTGSFADWFYKTWGMTQGCNDMLWSGHTSQSCIGLLFIEKELRDRLRGRFNFIHVIMCGVIVVYFLIYMWAVLSCRMHYTIDVFIASIIAVTLFTHSNLRFFLWAAANHIVCNKKHEPDGQSTSSDEEDEESDDDASESRARE